MSKTGSGATPQILGGDVLKNTPKQQHESDDEILFQEMMSVASASECTGLMPAAPISNAQVDALREIYPIPPGQRDILLQKTGLQKKVDSAK